MRLYFVVLTFLLIGSTNLHAEEVIKFSCSWDNAKPIIITVTPDQGVATRSDGDTSYKIIKLTTYAVWLEIVEPYNQSGLKIQMIQRASATNNKGGKWVDTVHSMSGMVSPIDGGICWEQ